MNATWFYKKENPYAQANALLQLRNWRQAETEYQQLLAQKAGSEYDQNMAALNLASAQMAQRKASEHWQSFDKLCGISAKCRLTSEQLESLPTKKDGTVIVHSDQVGIGDIAHFLPLLSILKKRGAPKVFFAVRDFMHAPLHGPSKAYEIDLINEKKADTVAGYHTHLIALYGLLQASPAQLACEKPIYTTTEEALHTMRNAINPHEGHKMAILFVGEKRPATLIGGKQLPHNPEEHGRELDARAFEPLLKNQPTLLLLDCNPEKSRITFNTIGSCHLEMTPEYKKRIVPLPVENKPFDSIIALGLIWNRDEERFVGFAGDNGPPNLFAHTLTKGAQKRFAFIIPNGKEYDMRMEGEGPQYTHMLSHCPVYCCKTPAEQASTIICAYKELTHEKHQTEPPKPPLFPLQ